MKYSIIFMLLASALILSNCHSLNKIHFESSNLEIINDDLVVLNVSDSSARYFVIGDWGGLPVFPYRSFIEQAVSMQMSTMAKLYNTQFQMALGDNFYTNGIANDTDKRFKQTFETVFDKQYLNTPWFLLMGNHDHYGNASAQISYSKKSSRWVMPNYNYTINVRVNNGNDDLIQIVMLDTVILCGNSGYDNEIRQPKFDTLKDKIKSENYFKALEKQLMDISNSSTPYVLVAGHFPVWSISAHGPTKCLVDKLRPLLHKYEVSAYLCGHDHNLQHLTDTFMNVTVEHFLSGASNFNDNSTAHQNDVPNGSLKYFWSKNELDLIHGGIAYVDANKDNMTLTFVETDGKELYQKTIYPRKNSKKF